MKYYSQYNQDKFLNERLFKGKENGVFIEIGADDGMVNSNTYFFEKFKNWNGICIEPRKNSFENLVKNRKVICVNCCISDVESSTKSKFLKIDGHAGQLSGLMDKYDERHLERIKKVIGEKGILKNIVEIECNNLNNLVEKYGIKHVDFCSIDTEGGELDILKSINYSKIDIDVILVENNFKSNKIKIFLRSKGYRKIASISVDEIYARKNTQYYNYIYTKDYINDIFEKIYIFPIRVKNFILRKIKANIGEETRIFLKSILYKNYKDQYAEIKKMLTEINLSKPVLIDGGAHKGQTILKFKKIFPGSEIYAFEPIPELAGKLKIIEDTTVTVFDKALGEKDGKIEFRVNNSTATSSAFDSDLVHKYYPGVAELNKKISVDCVTIDGLLKTQKIKQPDVIKLDLQGYELYALEGAKETLINTKIVLTEVEFIPLYKNQPLFEDIAQFMKDNNFRLYNFFDIQNNEFGQIIYADAIFINNMFFEQ